MIPMCINEKIVFRTNLLTLEKRWISKDDYDLIVLRKRKAEIHIVANHIKKTISVNGKIYQFRTNYGYVYKKAQGNVIEGSDFIRLLTHIKESSETKNTFHKRTADFLTKLSKNTYTTIN
jgi:hypothetical protein